VSDEEGEYRCAQCKINQVSRKPVRRLLNWGARPFRILDGFYDLAEGGLFPVYSLAV
jgi:hypothetical protein